MDIWIFYLIGGVAFLGSHLVRTRLLGRYKEWSRPNNAGITGGDTARVILNANGIHDVQVVPAKGKLTDHYEPLRKIIRLSETNYGSPTVAAMAISAHEAGHAIQDAKDYVPLKIRNTIAPLANAAARFGLPAAIFGGLLGSPFLVQAGVLAYVGALLFQFLALPVEYDASRRAMQQLESLTMATADERKGVESVLRSAALTYVAGVASAALFIIFLAVDSGRALFGKKPPTPPG